MPIIDQEKWNKCVQANSDPYGKACVDVARRAMEILDESSSEIDCYGLISRADDESKAGGITGFMAGCVANIISSCHSRGEEFRKLWNSYYISDESKLEEANRNGGVVNPAILTIG